MGFGYGVIVVPCHSCIQPLDTLEWMGSLTIKVPGIILSMLFFILILGEKFEVFDVTFLFF